MSVETDIAAMKRQLGELKSSVAAARGEAKAVAIALSAIIDVVKLREPQILNEF